MDLLELKALLPKVQDQLLRKPNTVGVSIAEKVTRGKSTGKLGFTVLVRKKIDASLLWGNELIPATIDGVRTDVLEVGDIVAHSNTAMQRPAPAGVSISHAGGGSGTLGYFLHSEADSQLYILSSNHAMAEVNAGRFGDNILQPGTQDGGQNPADRVGTLYRFPLLADGATVDCALARVAAAGAVEVAALDGFSDRRTVPGPWGRAYDGGDVAACDISGTGRPDLLIFRVMNDGGVERGAYCVGWNLNAEGMAEGWTEWMTIPGGWSHEIQGTGVGLADISRSGRPDLVVFHIDKLEDRNRGYYQIGWNLDEMGRVESWSPPIPIPGWWGHEHQAAGCALADLKGIGQLDMVVFDVENPEGANKSYYRIGWNVDMNGMAASWTEPIPIEGWWGQETEGAGVALADVNGDGLMELIVVNLDNPTGENTIWYRVGDGIQPNGRVTHWSLPRQIPGWAGRLGMGGGVAVTDLNADGHPDLIVFHIDTVHDQTMGYYRVANCCTPRGFRWADPLRGAAPAALGDRVWKTGRTTELTSGRVTGLGATVDVDYQRRPPGVLRLQDQMLIQPAISRQGDSGSVIVGDQGSIVGLLCGGSDVVTVANRIENVLESFRCTEVRTVPGWFGESSQAADVALWDISGSGRPDMVLFHVDNPEGDNRGFYRIGWNVDGHGKVEGWTQPIPIAGWWGQETQRGGIALADLNGTGLPDLIVFHIDNAQGQNRGFYRIGWNMDHEGRVESWTNPTPIPGWAGRGSQAGSIAVADVDGNGRPELILFHVDSLQGENRGFYRIGWNLNAGGAVTGGWSDPVPMPGVWGQENQSGGIAVADLTGSGRPDLIIFHVDRLNGSNTGHYAVGRNLDRTGRVTGGWTLPISIPGRWADESRSGGIAVADLTGTGRPDMVVFHIDHMEGENRGCWRVLFDLMPNGEAARWFVA